MAGVDAAVDHRHDHVYPLWKARLLLGLEQLDRTQAPLPVEQRVTLFRARPTPARREQVALRDT